MLYFHSPNHMPIEAVSMLGLSAKETETAIGRFGTGLKYAIAVVLRTGGSITLVLDGERITFTIEEKAFRDKPYKAIIMHGPAGPVQLPFTLDYGRDWEPWMAYRELFSNCLDERGGVSTSPVSDRVVFEVSGLDAVHDRHHEIFLDTKLPLLFANGEFEIYKKPSQFFYYRGIRVQSLQQPLQYTYNCLRVLPLTEDRTVPHRYPFNLAFGEAMFKQMDRHTLTLLFLARHDMQEHAFAFTAAQSSSLSPDFIAAVQTGTSVPTGAAMAVRRHLALQRTYIACDLTPFEQEELSRAVRFAKRQIPQLDSAEVYVSRGMNDVLGKYLRDTGEIYISHRAFDEGFDSLCATVMEEAFHKYNDVEDETRGFQELLLKRLVLAEKRALWLEERK